MASHRFVKIAVCFFALSLFLVGWVPGIASQEPLPPGASAVVMGQVLLQGSMDSGGIVIQVGGQSTTSRSDGLFILPRVVPGTYAIAATFPGFLGLQTADLYLGPGDVIFLPEATLLGGDVNGNGLIDLTDLVTLGAAFGQSPPADSGTDLNRDGRVDISDFVILGTNYGKTAPLVWEAPSRPTPTATMPVTPTATATPTPTGTAVSIQTPTPTDTLPMPTATPTGTAPSEPTATPTQITTVQPAAYELRIWLSNDEPRQFSQVTVYAQLTHGALGLPGATMEAAWQFASGTAYCAGTTGANGVASCARNIGAATPGVPVSIEVVVFYAGQVFEQTVSITPR